MSKTTPLFFVKRISFLSEVKIILCVVVSDTSYDLVQGFEIGRVFSVLNPSADKVTHNTSEIFVSWVGYEGAAIREHTYEAGEHTEISESSHL